jgi:hypothetical protein
MNYKNPRLYEWIYRNDMFQTKTQPKAQPKAQPTKEKNDIEDIANEWDTPQISIILFQSKTSNDMRN